MSNDVVGQIENREDEQPLLNKVQYIDDSTYTTISIGERVDALKLIMNDRQFDQWVDAIIRGIDIPFQIGKKAHDILCVVRRCVYDLVHRVSEDSPGKFAQTIIAVLHDTEQVDEQIDRQGVIANQLVVPIPHSFFVM